MTPLEQQIYDLVHAWCDGQYGDIPDMNRRMLMDRILELHAECDHPFAFVNSSCDGEINTCLKCGEQL